MSVTLLEAITVLTTRFSVLFVRSCSGDHTVKLIDFATGTYVKDLSGHRRTPWTVGIASPVLRMKAMACVMATGQIPSFASKPPCERVARL